MATSNKVYKYKKPDPFVMPQVFTTNTIPAINIPKETLEYSASIIEEIMKNINNEYEIRGRTKPTWKRYKAGVDDFDTFNPSIDGTNVAQICIKFFPQIVRDIQVAIESLVSESKYQDTMGSFFARVFGDNTISHQKGTWSSSNRIKDGYIVPATNATGKQTLNPLTAILAGGWPFPVDTGNYRGEGHVENPLARFGVGLNGEKFIALGAGSLESSAPGWPEAQITSSGTPNFGLVSNRKNASNTSTGFGAGLVDLDAGYTYLCHHPLIIQQLRWQSPIIERFDGPESVPDRHYTQNVYSNTTPNLGFVFTNPAERLFLMNWGNWLIKGKASSDSTGLNLIASPEQYNGFIPTNCPFSVFYPPQTVNCSCQQGDTSYAVWGAGGLSEPLSWSNIEIIQSSEPSTLYKRIGPKTRIRVKHSYSFTLGSPNHKHYYAIFIRLNSIGTINLQPFIPIFVSSQSEVPTTLSEISAVKSMSQESHSDGSKSINLMEAIKKSYPQHLGIEDVISAIAIFVHQEVFGQQTCPVIDVSGGSVISPECAVSLQCTMGTITSKTEYIQLFEPPFDGQNDMRLA